MTVPFETSTPLGGIPHGFFGRQGGVSAEPFSTLNVSEAAGDDPGAVSENRARIANSFGKLPEALVTLRQTHSNRVVTHTARPDPAERPEADAHVTNVPELLLGVLTADCTPILLADPQAGVVGAAHAGWKGAVDGIIGNTVAAMVALGATPANLIAAIGPTISQANYEVGPQFMTDFLALHPTGAEYFVTPHDGREHFDLPGFVAGELHRAGVRKIQDLALCTYAHPDRYFSHRHATHHHTATGRQLAVIGL